MRRNPSAAGDLLDPAEPVERISAEHSSPPVRSARHRHVVSPDRSLVRRLAPLAVGAAAMLMATSVAIVVRPDAETTVAEPELGVALVDVDPTRTRRTFGLPSATPTSAASDASTAAEATAAEASADAKDAVDRTAETTARAAIPDVPDLPDLPDVLAPEPTSAAGDGDDGAGVASARGWTQTGGDEFDGSLSSMWSPYVGAGHAGNGRRTADALSVRNGMLVIRGDSQGNTGGMAWSEDQKYGRWEMRARFPAGDDQYHPVLILWPGEVAWPLGGEIDFAETTSASDKVSFFLHYSAQNRQKYAHQDIDITQWHTYAVEWTPTGITGFIDGEAWFSSTDPATFPPGPMHATIQLDYFPKGGSPQPTELHVDWMRIYS